MEKTVQRILIVEDEPKLASVLQGYLQQAEFDCDIIGDGALVLPAIKAASPDLVLLDVMLPNIDGVTLCQQIRTFSNIPIIMTTARVAEIDRLIGLETGADDYICKPYSPREVVARVKALLRRTALATSIPHEAGSSMRLTMDAERLLVHFNGNSVSLTQIEFELLQALTVRPGVIVSRDRLMTTIYKDHRVVSDRTIDSHIKKLRRKLASIMGSEDPISSVYGAGYRFTDMPSRV
ncbi:MAG: two-component system response regulator BaeR [unclassified Hahellaceae]|nr:two-component system response regulator BaeR [Hahellaceae bacterium]|tara:strand:- start:7468 stop:8175 length:708 start_codon:yes stop_codon:yes gene_type:complete